ncbi:prolyl oligopeptidase family serine peptidase [Muriicola sp. E247]|uniref:prolyl oligopeptidase family serine peptidase n=1 Tax=Muriicola sp. E247 TaxID=3242730 RepID=UPI003525E420
MNKNIYLLIVIFIYQFAFSQEINKSDQYEWLSERHSTEVIEWVEQQNTKSLDYFESVELLNDLEKWKVKFDKQYDWKTFGKFLTEAEQVGLYAEGITGKTWFRMPFETYLAGMSPGFFEIKIKDLNINSAEDWLFDRVESNPNNFDQSLVFYKKKGHTQHQGFVEFDSKNKRKVENGFELPPSRTTAKWRDEASIYICTNLENPYRSASKLHIWERGSPIETAKVIFEAPEPYTTVELISLNNALLIKEQRQAYDDSWYHLKEDKLNPLFFPRDVKDLVVVSGQLIVHLRSQWKTKDFDFGPSSLITINFESFLKGDRSFQLLAESSKAFVLDEIWNTNDVLILRVLKDVQSSLYEWTFSDVQWKSKEIIDPSGWNIFVTKVQKESNRYLIRQQDFFGTKLFLRDENGTITKYAERINKMIKPSEYEVKQQFATSKDGTQVPYFLVHKKGLKMEGTIPVMMTAYGGWGRSMLPRPLGARWRWIMDGGAYVLANIRAGGEYGNEWHYSAIKSKRQNAYDDFFAVAQDLIDSGLSQERSIGIYGGSNGGLLVANAFIQHPSTFGAILIRSGSLKLDDVSLKETGNSFGPVRGERGDHAIPQEWMYMKKISPFHVLEKGKPYPPVLLLSSRNDDVSHPSRSRKFYAKMTALGSKKVYLIETAGGRHGYTDLDNETAIDLAFFYKNIHPEYEERLMGKFKRE